MDGDGKFTIEGDNEDEHPIFKHNKAIERYLKNPDSVITDFTGHRFIFKVKSGYITYDDISDVEEIIHDTAINYEYPFHGMDITDDQIEIRVEISVNEAPLESAERFLERLEQAGIDIDLVFLGTLDKE